MIVYIKALEVVLLYGKFYFYISKNILKGYKIFSYSNKRLADKMWFYKSKIMANIDFVRFKLGQ